VPGGPGVRWDGGVETGSEVGLSYDPMLAKLIVWGASRTEAVDRMHRALLELTVDGIETSREFHLRVMEDDEFRRGAIEIQWLERRLDSLLNTPPSAAALEVAAIASALVARESARRRSSGGSVVRTPGSPRPFGSAALDWAEDPGQRETPISDWGALARREGLRER
jgi:acetyl-CoA carboxylase biotin carboxylase subunit